MEISKPTLIINENKVRQNIKKFVNKANKSNVRFRPHFKTHQSQTIGNWFKEYGVSSITVSSVDMAQYFSNAGWEDITIAFPVNIRQLEEINTLAKHCTLGVLIESSETASTLIERISNPINVWIEVDQGYHRTGVQQDNKILDIAGVLERSSSVNFTGLLTHAGHAYHAKSVEDLHKIHAVSKKDLIKKKRKLRENGFTDCLLSIGDTLTCSVTNDFTGIDEIRPGSFVFYDLEQSTLGACNESELAMGVACPVVAKYPSRNQLIIYGGAVHLSKEFLLTPSGEKSFGKVAYFSDQDWTKSLSETYVSSISQEHGIIHTKRSILEKIQIGDIVFIYPVHSCLTANLFNQYYTLKSEKIGKMQSLLT